MLSSEIRYFLAVANTGSLSAASEQLFVAVSAISRQIQRLENQVGVPLFARHARGMVLNEAGEIFAHHVRKNLLDMEYALAEIKGLKAVRRTLIRVACTDGLAFTLLPRLIADFRNDNPGVLFDVKVASTQGVAEALRNGECDVALQFSLHAERGVEVMGSWPAPVLIVMHQTHPLATAPQVTLADLSHYPLALPQQNTTVRQLFELASHMNGSLVEPVMTCDTFSMLFQFLLRTPQAVTICSAFTVLQEAETHGLILRSVGIDQLSQRTLQLQTQSGRPRSAALNVFLSFLLQQLDALEEPLRQRWKP
ncbi:MULTISPECIES: LysR family transcriptional regulator [Pantoea]|jgi:DNA-binding transcriptional LysR family regulator|uniref:DNA-binding transcriptional regulator, LysR family n=2 Tax=Pantoea TaxID=53335 RepID=A0A1I3TTF1_9GAMM|nr:MULTISPECIES: LysR family transcriptional regulator [Pantoea]MDY0926803.1 LysR family transcriptional regulator [Enterobacter sp. CFBP8995]MRS20555.1 LysR family transcriptional regulator [Enterobacteriaceae bacterium RIT692]MRT25358.1 LysR family transcriptional regulator [Enterobacteriaceae bacterium RIT697]KAJ9433049.1 LysR family transcriptional regulator [Pantoea sp. YR343]MCQ8227778.1 LysR family transcriptional regulator [Pantoea sp. MMK2]